MGNHGRVPAPDRSRLAPVLVGLMAGQLENAAAELQRRYNGQHADGPQNDSTLAPWPGSTISAVPAAGIPAGSAAPTGDTSAAGMARAAPRQRGGEAVPLERGPHLLGLTGPMLAAGSAGAAGARSTGSTDTSSGGGASAVCCGGGDPVELGPQVLSFSSRDELDRAVNSVLYLIEVGPWVRGSMGRWVSGSMGRRVSGSVDRRDSGSVGQWVGPVPH